MLYILESIRHLGNAVLHLYLKVLSLRGLRKRGKGGIHHADLTHQLGQAGGHGIIAALASLKPGNILGILPGQGHLLASCSHCGINAAQLICRTNKFHICLIFFQDTGKLQLSVQGSCPIFNQVQPVFCLQGAYIPGQGLGCNGEGVCTLRLQIVFGLRSRGSNHNASGSQDLHCSRHRIHCCHGSVGAAVTNRGPCHCSLGCQGEIRVSVGHSLRTCREGKILLLLLGCDSYDDLV